jgi:hypothetical protein
MNGGRGEEVIIPELERELETYDPRYREWTEKEEGIMLRYYGKVSMDSLIKQLGRTKTSIFGKASRMGLTE